ncbi:hypothetical protein [Engelhardtia mirabilis]|uniref:Uncharacterized protein n=1 Tax=Engelhardtia mirabilis TaxID=2528011 RepID=A0A518BER2_9BACT|nr:hypothetical protein Pla133_05330 [Planctomycetes bacterium Pla133]QDU99794.1 hypothetical protein Pla86_05330 [Planctomycetes bacterium Pla86]
MKLFSAQRVKNDDGVVGINTYRYHVDGDRVDGDDIDQLGGRARLEINHFDLPPGRNQVLSFLDVLTPDDTGLEQIAEWIKEVHGDTEIEAPPIIRRDEERGVLRLNLVRGLVPTWREELRDLAGRLLLLLPD